MKKIVLFLIAALFSVTMFAAKALHRPTTITQSDGTKLTVIGYGDEHFHYYTTMDGVLLYHEGYDFFIAGIDENGKLICTTQLAHEASERTEEEIALINRQDKDKFFDAANTQAAKARTTRAASVAEDNTLFPHIGSPKVLVILAEFQDVKFTVNETKKAFEQYLNAEGHNNSMQDFGNDNKKNVGSVKQYFNDVSFGKFVPQFDVYGPVTLPEKSDYYGKNVGEATDINKAQLLKDACTAVDEQINFKDYDQNNDGLVDLVYIIYAGYAESQNEMLPNSIWPHSWATNGGKYDGVEVYRYGVNNELNGTPEENKEKKIINGIGLFVHEFSHCMGMPDMYVTTAAPVETQNANNQEMERWSVMDSGCYLDSGYRPAAYTAWEREFFGWFYIETLEEPKFVELDYIDNGGKAYRIMNTNDETGNEYYIVENIQKADWNAKQYGHGMLVTHVDYDKDAFSLSHNSVNNVLGHPRMTVLAADGELTNGYTATNPAVYTGDPFPGTSNVHELTDETTVKPIVYNGTGLNKPIYDIQENEATGIVTFKFLDKNVTSISETVVEKEYKDNKIYTLDGRYVGTDTSVLQKGIYIINNKKVVIK